MNASEPSRAALRWLLVAAVAVAAPARAQTPPSPPPLTGLTWKAPDACLAAGELAQRVEELIGRTTFATSAARHVLGQLKAFPEPPRWRVKLTLVDDNGTVLGSRELSSDEPECHAIDESLVFVLAVMIDPEVALRAPVPSVRTPVRPPPEPAPPPREPVPPRPAPSDRPSLAPAPFVPGQLRMSQGSFFLNEHELSLSGFYGLVGRPDLQARHAQRTQLRIAGITTGSMAATVGAALFIAQALGAGCVRYAGTATSPGECLEGSPQLRNIGLITFGAGALVTLGSLFFNDKPTTDAEDAQLLDAFNARPERQQHRM